MNMIAEITTSINSVFAETNVWQKPNQTWENLYSRCSSLLPYLLLFTFFGLCVLTAASIALASLRGEHPFSVVIDKLQLIGFVILLTIFGCGIGILVGWI